MELSGLWLGLDVGTQGTKALLLDAASREVAGRAGVSYGLIEGLPKAAAEQHPETWWDAVVQACGQLRDQGHDLSSVRGVGVSGQQHGLVVLDEDMRVVRPAKLWCDTATTAEADDLAADWGRAVPVGFTASKVLWLQRHEPDAWARVRHVLLPHDYLNFQLTGRLVTEAGDASGTAYFDVAQRAYDGDAVRSLGPGFASMLPEVIPAHAAAGRVTATAAEQTGLPQGALVSSGGGDNMMSAIGSGATQPGVVVMSLGTSGTVFAYADQPVVDPAGLIAGFCDSTGGWLPLLCTMNVTGVTEEVRQAFGMSLEAITDLAAGEPAGCDGLMWWPYLQGERVPALPNATGMMQGMRAGCLSPGRLFRAAIEGATLNLAWGVDRMKDLGVAVDAVRLVGGGSKNVLWRQVVADVLNVPVVGLIESESAALGAAIQAVWCERRLEDDSIGADTVASAFVRLAPEAIEPSGGAAGVYGDLRQRFAEGVRSMMTGSA